MTTTALPAPAVRRPLTVRLVDMPFASSRRPSIQLGLLQAILARRGTAARTVHLNLELAQRLGWDRYEALCHARDLLLGEWLFARAAFGPDAPPPEPYLRRHAAGLAATGEDPAGLAELRETAFPALLDEWAARSEWAGVDVAGFSSIFEQNCAALGLARRLRARGVTTVFGGANFEDEMGLEYVRAVPWIDYAVIGEGDEVLPALLDRLATGADPGDLPGVASRAADGTVRFPGRAPQVATLDPLPEPDYADYFADVARLRPPATVRGQPIGLPFESARGCWWGAKHHCTFCGLNALGMAFRSKSPERALAGLDELAERHGTYTFLSVDNILDQRYVEGVFAPLARQRKDYTFFFEVKSTLTAAQLRTLSRGGARILQPGIESLSTPLLRIMRKGATALQNVRFLKWGRYHQLVVTWNLLTGFPGERVEDYATQLRTIGLIGHLCPPGYVGRIRLDRFSPNFTELEELGFTRLGPLAAYGDVYPDRFDLAAIAYTFDYSAPRTLQDEAYEPLRRAVEDWQAAWAPGELPPLLAFRRGAGRLTVTDTRPGFDRVTTWGETEARVYEAITPTARTAAAVRRDLGDGVPAEEILADFAAAGLALEEDGQYLGLALPANPNW